MKSFSVLLKLTKKISAASNRFTLLSIVLTFIIFGVSGCKKTDTERASIVPPVRTSTKPNIILILGDDIGYEIPTYTGGESYSTPNIDNLARQGMQFTECRASPKCSPSRFMLMTGKYNFRNYTYWGHMDTTQRTIANMLHDKGYETCVAGKWQFDGGDASIRKFGFDKYLVFLPYEIDEDAENKHRYKNPNLYENGSFLNDAATKNKYADDMFTDYISNFIDSNKTKPFFIYFPMSLAHIPFSPTPDDPEFTTWDPDQSRASEEYFPSMIAYMDKVIGEVVSKIQSVGLDDNTIIMYLGDNGTTRNVQSMFDGSIVTGEKGYSTEHGIHVPLVIRWPQNVQSASASNTLIDFTDFMPTIANMANVPLPTTYGTLDGVSFYPALKNLSGEERSWTFCHWNFDYYDPSKVKRWVQNGAYKLYDSTYNNYFFNFSKDVEELSPLEDSELTPQELLLKVKFHQVFSQMHN